MTEKITIYVQLLYAEDGNAKLAASARYARDALEEAGNGNDIVLTGPGPVWLYLVLAHELHGKARSLRYDSPVTGEIVIFDHNPE